LVWLFIYVVGRSRLLVVVGRLIYVVVRCYVAVYIWDGLHYGLNYRCLHLPVYVVWVVPVGLVVDCCPVQLLVVVRLWVTHTHTHTQHTHTTVTHDVGSTLRLRLRWLRLRLDPTGWTVTVCPSCPFGWRFLCAGPLYGYFTVVPVWLDVVALLPHYTLPHLDHTVRRLGYLRSHLRASTCPGYLPDVRFYVTLVPSYGCLLVFIYSLVLQFLLPTVVGWTVYLVWFLTDLTLFTYSTLLLYPLPVVYFGCHARCGCVPWFTIPAVLLRTTRLRCCRRTPDGSGYYSTPHHTTAPTLHWTLTAFGRCYARTPLPPTYRFFNLPTTTTPLLPPDKRCLRCGLVLRSLPPAYYAGYRLHTAGSTYRHAARPRRTRSAAWLPGSAAYTFTAACRWSFIPTPAIRVGHYCWLYGPTLRLLRFTALQTAAHRYTYACVASRVHAYLSYRAAVRRATYTHGWHARSALVLCTPRYYHFRILAEHSRIAAERLLPHACQNNTGMRTRVTASLCVTACAAAVCLLQYYARRV